MPELYLVRHCEPAVTGVLLGQRDPALSEVGMAHAASLLVGVALKIVYTSPLRRALETAQIIARGAPIDVMGGLCEITYGAWDGREWSEIEAADPVLAARKLEDWKGITPPGGESWDDFARRVKLAFELIRNGPRPAAIVGHAAVNQVLCGIDQAYGEVHEL